MLIHWIWLTEKRGISIREKLTLLEHFRDPEDIYGATAQDLDVLGLDAEKTAILLDKSLLDAENILERCIKKRIHILPLHDRAYPARLRNIPDPPPVLYYAGTLPDFDANPVIGVVGTRKASAYGMNTAKRLGGQIARCGGLVVSGMAFGIDAMATAGALAAGSVAVGVLGNGVDIDYPATNGALFRQMRKEGCLISEYAPGVKATKWSFPRRNRIISGLSCGVLVVEAPEKSGALITARQAGEQGRDLFVVPGNIGVASCAGSNALLREGAIMVSSGYEVLSEYIHLFPDKIHKEEIPAQLPAEKPWQQVAQPAVKPAVLERDDKKVIDNGALPPYSGVNETISALTPDEQLLIRLLAGRERLIDDLIAESKLSTGAALAALTMLEVKGITMTLPGRRVMCKK